MVIQGRYSAAYGTISWHLGRLGGTKYKIRGVCDIAFLGERGDIFYFDRCIAMNWGEGHFTVKSKELDKCPAAFEK